MACHCKQSLVRQKYFMESATPIAMSIKIFVLVRRPALSSRKICVKFKQGVT